MTAPDPRLLPAPPIARSRCEGCRRDIVWAITVAGPNGRGGKLMPLDPLEDLAGNVAVTPTPGGRLTARVLHADEQVDRPIEYSAMTHFATCPVRSKPEIPAQIIDLQEARQRRRRARRRHPARSGR